MEKQEELCAEVNKRAPSLLESGKYTDCKFVVGAEPYQVVVVGYKLVMAMASPVFEAMFYGSLAETRDYIPIVDVEPEIFKAMLQYIYTGNIKLSSYNEAIRLYYVANKYMLYHLMDECSKYLQNNVNLGNVCQLYEHSQLYEDEVLTQKCINIFTQNTKELLQDNSFKDAALTTVEKIFSLSELNIDSEADLINAAALYVTAQDDKVVEKKSNSLEIYTAPLENVMNVENNVKGSIETQNATDGAEQAPPGSSHMMNDTVNKQQIRSVVRHIRLLTLTPQQYADCTARSSLLTSAEDHAVLLKMVSNKRIVPMPSGLSKSRVRRDKAGKARSVATFRYTLQNFSSLEWEESPVFYVRNLPWRIVAMSRDEQGIKYLAVGVYCNKESSSTNWSCAANVKITLICHKPGAENLVRTFQHLYKSNKHQLGYPNFLPWSTVLDPTQGYIQDDAVTIEVHVAAEEPQGGHTSVTVRHFGSRCTGHLEPKCLTAVTTVPKVIQADSSSISNVSFISSQTVYIFFINLIIATLTLIILSFQYNV